MDSRTASTMTCASAVLYRRIETLLIEVWAPVTPRLIAIMATSTHPVHGGTKGLRRFGRDVDSHRRGTRRGERTADVAQAACREAGRRRRKASVQDGEQVQRGSERCMHSTLFAGLLGARGMVSRLRTARFGSRLGAHRLSGYGCARSVCQWTVHLWTLPCRRRLEGSNPSMQGEMREVVP